MEVLGHALLTTCTLPARTTAAKAYLELSRLLVRGSHGFNLTATWFHVALLSAQPRSLPVEKPRPLASSGLAQIPFGRKRVPYKPLPVQPLESQRNIGLGHRET